MDGWLAAGRAADGPDGGRAGGGRQPAIHPSSPAIHPSWIVLDVMLDFVVL